MRVLCSSRKLSVDESDQNCQHWSALMLKINSSPLNSGICRDRFCQAFHTEYLLRLEQSPLPTARARQKSKQRCYWLPECHGQN
eukprot:jgi/Botrbrau1/15639/Bobra.4_1s0024.1